MTERSYWPAFQGSRACVMVAAALLTTACATVGPDYARPEAAMPGAFREPAPEPEPEAEAAAPADDVSLADERWPAVFAEEPLRGLIGEALEQNYDLQAAAARVLQAQALLGITRANQLPTLDVQGLGQGQRAPALGSDAGQARTVGAVQVSALAAWEIDFWGRYRRATESARAQILASEWGRRAITTSLVSQVASSYYTLLSLDLELSIATRTLATREESLRLTQVRESGGAGSLVDVRQAEQLVHGARATIVDLQGAIEQQENAVSLLLGRYAGAIPRGRPLVEQPRAPDVPAGLPSALLERRPDIQQAEQLIVSANAEIGVARAAYFPQVTLTGSGGIATAALMGLFPGPIATWTAAASATQSVFNGGRIRSNVALAEARRQEAILAYQLTIRTAFREVSDALIQYRRTRELRDTQERLVRAAQDARRLADLRYQGGATSYLEVLDSDTRLFVAELGLVRAQRGELTGFVEIYRALGGGWLE